MPLKQNIYVYITLELGYITINISSNVNTAKLTMFKTGKGEQGTGSGEWEIFETGNFYPGPKLVSEAFSLWYLLFIWKFEMRSADQSAQPRAFFFRLSALRANKNNNNKDK